MIFLKSYNNYTAGNVLAGSQLICDFVWNYNSLLVNGEWNNAYACFHWFLNALSPSLRSLLSVFPVYEFSMCFQQQDESKIECKVQDMLPFIKRKYPTMRQFYHAKKLKDQKETHKQITNLRLQFEATCHKELLYKSRQNSKCDNCGKRCNLISEEPISESLFTVEPINFDPKFVDHKNELKEDDCQVYFPEAFSVDLLAFKWP